RRTLDPLAAGLKLQDVDAERPAHRLGETLGDVAARNADRLLAQARRLALAELVCRLAEQQDGQDVRLLQRRLALERQRRLRERAADLDPHRVVAGRAGGPAGSVAAIGCGFAAPAATTVIVGSGGRTDPGSCSGTRSTNRLVVSEPSTTGAAVVPASHTQPLTTPSPYSLAKSGK